MGSYDNSLFEELDVEAFDEEYWDENGPHSSEFFGVDSVDYWNEDGPSIWDDPEFEDDWMEFYVDEEEEEENES